MPSKCPISEGFPAKKKNEKNLCSYTNHKPFEDSHYLEMLGKESFSVLLLLLLLLYNIRTSYRTDNSVRMMMI